MRFSVLIQGLHYKPCLKLIVKALGFSGCLIFNPRCVPVRYAPFVRTIRALICFNVVGSIMARIDNDYEDVNNGSPLIRKSMYGFPDKRIYVWCLHTQTQLGIHGMQDTRIDDLCHLILTNPAGKQSRTGLTPDII
jgi:hypothetical protein